MIVHELRSTPSSKLAQALAVFEEQFHYPLGPERFFRINHGEDYTRFYGAMGEGVCFVAERNGRIQGVVSAALRRLVMPSGEEVAVVYFGDMKTDTAARGGRTLLRLSEAVKQWIGSRAAAAFGVAMDGTSVTPLRYTGRLGIPLFSELGKIVVLRLPTSGIQDDLHPAWSTTEEHGNACYSDLIAGRYTCFGGDPAVRSETQPAWLMEPERRACGRLEDTRRAKRLIANDGIEMQSAHLSCFAYRDLGNAVKLLQRALRLAANLGFPNLFVAVPDQEARIFCETLEGIEVVVAPATIYGTGIESGRLWNINTAEI
jgi:hypothetical protein